MPLTSVDSEAHAQSLPTSSVHAGSMPESTPIGRRRSRAELSVNTPTTLSYETTAPPRARLEEIIAFKCMSSDAREEVLYGKHALTKHVVTGLLDALTYFRNAVGLIKCCIQ